MTLILSSSVLADSTDVSSNVETANLVLKVNGKKSQLYADLKELPQNLSTYRIDEIDCTGRNCPKIDFSFLVYFLRNKSEYMFNESLKIVSDLYENEIYSLDGDLKYSKGKKGVFPEIDPEFLLNMLLAFEDISIKLVYTICTDSTHEHVETIEFDMALEIDK